jgi:hypothetical protein
VTEFLTKLSNPAIYSGLATVQMMRVQEHNPQGYRSKVAVVKWLRDLDDR